MIPDKWQATFLTSGWLTKDMIVKSGHRVDMRGKFLLCLPKLSMLLLVLLGDDVEAAVQIGNLLRQFAQLGAMLHVPLLQGLCVLFLELGYQCRQVCSFIHTGLHVSVVPQNLLGSF